MAIQLRAFCQKLTSILNVGMSRLKKK